MHFQSPLGISLLSIVQKMVFPFVFLEIFFKSYRSSLYTLTSVTNPLFIVSRIPEIASSLFISLFSWIWCIREGFLTTNASRAFFRNFPAFAQGGSWKMTSSKHEPTYFCPCWSYLCESCHFDRALNNKFSDYSQVPNNEYTRLTI